ncbi:hypothetical protein FQR65_LT18521 [Abscondita terminalis]|nr:hypothetical protein FQR65_LT18521 [Abscondita terminalis]
MPRHFDAPSRWWLRCSLRRAEGLDAQPLISSTTDTASETIVTAAEELDVESDCLGHSRPPRNYRNILLGKHSANVLHHAPAPPGSAVLAAAQVLSGRDHTSVTLIAQTGRPRTHACSSRGWRSGSTSPEDISCAPFPKWEFITGQRSPKLIQANREIHAWLLEALIDYDAPHHSRRAASPGFLTRHLMGGRAPEHFDRQQVRRGAKYSNIQILILKMLSESRTILD